MRGTIKTEYDEIYSAYADLLYRLALSHLKNSYDAEDAVQETFIAYFYHKGNFADDNHRKAWLVRVLLNKCTDHIRKSTRVKTVEIDDSVAAKNDQDDGVFDMVMSLEEKYKTPFLLYYFEGFDIKETASILKLTVSAVKMRLKRGREMLKTALGDETE